MRIPTRPEVRAAVQRNREERLAATAAGAIPEQVLLDQQDRVHLFADALQREFGETAAIQFLTMWAQETDALAAEIQREIERTAEQTERLLAQQRAAEQRMAQRRLEQQAEQQDAGLTAERIGATIGSVILFVVLYVILRSL